MYKLKLLKINKKVLFLLLEVVIFTITCFLIITVNDSNKKQNWEYVERDIYYEYLHGIDMIKGKNPYEKVLQYDLLTNHKYATLFPLYYYYIGGLASVSNFNYDTFLSVYRTQLYIAEIIAGLVIYILFKRVNNPILGYLAAAFFMFNRWTIANILDGKQDVIAIMFLMLFFYFFTSNSKSHKLLAYLFYGISIGFKHIGIFIAPILLLPYLEKVFTIKDLLKGVTLFIIPTIMIGLFVILSNPLHFFILCCSLLHVNQVS
jgi:hypothetical protein